VALGTSLPEVATSLVAAARGQRDIAVGNVIGSNLFNLVGVLGATAAIAPGGVPIAPATLVLDLPFMVVVAVACLPICWTRWTVERWEGALLLALFCAYTTYLVLGATDPERVPAPTTALWVLSSPLLLVTLLAFWPRPRAAS
jgi:cation:H+ antiporter